MTTEVQATSVTSGVPGGDLAIARACYDQEFGKPPDLEPVPGSIVEHETGGVWVQLMGGETAGPGWVLRVGVADLAVKRRRLADMGVEVGPVETVPGVIGYFVFHDPDGNELSWYRGIGSPGCGAANIIASVL